MDIKRLILIVTAGLVALTAVVILWFGIKGSDEQEFIDALETEQEAEVDLLYGIDYSDLIVEDGVIQSGQTISTIFSRYGISPALIDRTAKAAEPVFSLKNIRAGHGYTLFIAADSTNRLVHFVYEHNLTEYLVISYEGDSVNVRKEVKDIEILRRTGSGTITSSLWNAMVGNGMPAALSMDLEGIYAWTIDFFALQKDDRFTVIYDDKIVDSTSVGIGRIWGAVFHHSGKDYYAIPFMQNGKITYWDENGNSLRKGMLKAPLQYSRISSKFSNSRMHPVLRIRRPHHGVDYAAPSGTPVHAVADGMVIFKGWDKGGGGNTLKIKHSARLTTGYLHLKNFAKGIANGTRVSQGDVIGYVGSTGTSTGPHLDYRVWQDGKPIDPLKITSEPAEPIAKANLADFQIVKERIMSELKGELPDSLKITSLDSLAFKTTPVVIPVDSVTMPADSVTTTPAAN